MKIFLIKNEKNNTNVVILLRLSDFDEQSRKDNILVSVLNISTGKPSKLGSRIKSARIMERYKPVICGQISPRMSRLIRRGKFSDARQVHHGAPALHLKISPFLSR